jgi:hypothetical protein
VDISATTSEPDPKKIVGTAVTSPYEIIAIARPPGMRGPVAFRLFLNGSRWSVFEIVKTIK